MWRVRIVPYGINVGVHFGATFGSCLVRHIHGRHAEHVWPARSTLTPWIRQIWAAIGYGRAWGWSIKRPKVSHLKKPAGATRTQGMWSGVRSFEDHGRRPRLNTIHDGATARVMPNNSLILQIWEWRFNRDYGRVSDYASRACRIYKAHVHIAT